MWNEILVALALVLIIEGITPFLSPKGLREAMQLIQRFSDGQLRMIGLASMVLGSILLYWLRQG
ncbi:MAG: DUF2065 family protein [Chromatiales bacterium]|jgi:uncharacterized protein YjeT (DUF2065 family)